MTHENVLQSPDAIFALIMASANEAFDALKQRPTFHEDWIKKRTFDNTRTMVRQSPFMGIGGGEGRTLAGSGNSPWRMPQRKGHHFLV